MFAKVDRRCSRCDQPAILPYYLCRGCRNEASRKRRKSHPKQVSEAWKRWRNKNRDKIIESQKWSRLKITYGLTRSAYESMLIGQAYGCAICGATKGCSKGRKLFVDHDHKTKRIRGLLCSKCNFLIGIAGDRPEILSKAISYLDREG